MRHSRYYWRLTNPAFLIVALLILSLVVWFEVSTAQVTTNITSDGTLGTEVTQAGNVHEITGGTRPGDGPNLFHSFGHFDVGTGDTAHFMGQPGIEHIIGRVTGGDASMIDGTLQSDASLFLLNPQGFMFGANATLNINGSFHVSTADVLRFADGAEFSTHLSEKSALTVAAPTAFGFLNENPAGIAIEGSTLAVPDGETVSIVGGDIAIRGGLLSAPSGQLHMTSVASAGDVISHPADQPSGLTVDTVERLGRIEITQETRLDVSGDGGGTISLRGGRLWIDSSTIAADTTGARNGAGIGIDIDVAEDVFVINGGVITTNALGAGKAGDIRIRSSNTEMSNSSFVSSQVAPDAVGDSGNITVEVESLKLEDGAQIFTNTLGAGQGGTVRVTATGAVMLSGTSRDGTFPSGIVTATQGRGTETGTAGAVVLKAAEVSATGGAQIFSITTGAGQGGTVTVIADTVTFGSSVLTPEAVFLSGLFANTFGSGHAGDVLVEAATVTLTEGAQIGSITFGPGHAGAVTVRATDAVILDGTVAAPDGRIFPSGIFAQTQGANEMAGNAGTVLVEATNLTLTGTAQISTSTNGPGSAGTLTIIAHESIDIVDQGGGPFRSGLFSNSGEGDEIAGNAGDIVIMAPRLTVDGGRILARTLGDGDAGNTVIQVERLELLRGGQLFNGIGNAQANGEILGNPNGTGRGGNLMVMATDSIVIDGQDIAGFFSSIGSNAQIGNGDAGNIFVSAPRLEMRKGGFISTGTSSGSRGNAGDLRVEVEWLMLTEGGQISSSTFGPGQGGKLAVTATESIFIAGQSSAGFNSGIFSTSDGSGDGGAISIITPLVTSDDGGRIVSRTLGGGDAGNIDVQVGRLELKGGSQIFSGTGDAEPDRSIRGIEDGTGRGGSVTVIATESIFITGRDSEGFESGILSTGQIGAGSAGNIFVSAPRLEMRESGNIGASSVRLSRGDAGTLTLEVDTLELTGGAQISSLTRGVGQGGNIIIRAHRLRLTEGATISSESSGVGDAGDIRVAATDISLSGDSAVTTEATQAGGGDITLESELISLARSTLTAEARGASQVGSDGGNVTIRASQIALNRSSVKANAFGGDGGEINIFASEAFVVDAETCLNRECLDASSQDGNDGTIEVQAPDVNLSETVTPLSSQFAQDTTLLSDQCVSRLRAGNVSSFVERGRDYVSVHPDGPLPRRLYRVSPDSSARATAETQAGKSTPADTDGLQVVSREPYPTRHWAASTRLVHLQELDCSKR